MRQGDLDMLPTWTPAVNMQMEPSIFFCGKGACKREEPTHSTCTWLTLQYDELIEPKSLDIGPGNCRKQLFRLLRNRSLDVRPCKSQRIDIQVSSFPDQSRPCKLFSYENQRSPCVERLVREEHTLLRSLQYDSEAFRGTQQFQRRSVTRTLEDE
jgi:hypothetical protein